jgi:PhnB protein
MSKAQQMGHKVQAYLFFDGRCEEALDFYQSALGAKLVMKMRFRESPDPVPAGQCAPNSEDKIMHSAFQVGDTLVMASDGMAGGKPEFKGFSLSVSAADEKEADRYFNALAKGGQVTMPMGKTFFSPRFGMVTDKFGMGWMVIVPGEM